MILKYSKKILPAGKGHRLMAPAVLMLTALLISLPGDAAQKSVRGRKPTRPAKKIERRKPVPARPPVEQVAVRPLELSLPPVEEYELTNGLKVFGIRDELPQFSIVVAASFGKLYEGRMNAGLSELLAKALTLGGSKRYPGDRLHEAVENIGGRITIWASWESVGISIRMLERHADLAMDILTDLLENPVLDEKSISDAKQLFLEEIRRKNDSPTTVAIERLREIMFDGVGYGSNPSEQSVKAIGQAELRTAFNNHFRAANMVVGTVSGPNGAATRLRVEKALSSLEPGARMNYRFDAARAVSTLRSSSKKIYFIRKPVPQATIVVGTLAPPLADPSSHALGVMNYILGEGSFSSRLVKDIRVDRGLSYVVQSVIRQRKETGVFLALAQTNTAQAPLTLRLMLENMEKMASTPVSPDELNWARQAMINSYIFEFETPLSLLDKYMMVYRMGLPLSYITDYRRGVAGIGQEGVRQAARSIFEPGFVRLVLGDAALEKKLSRFGEVVVLRP